MATTHLDDVDEDRSQFDGDGKSSIDLYETPEQLPQADGKSTIDLGDIAGADRALESVQNSAGDFTEVYTSEPTHSKLDSADKLDVKKGVDPPLPASPAANVENIASGAANIGEKADAKPAAKRGRPAKTAEATPADEAKTAE